MRKRNWITWAGLAIVIVSLLLSIVFTKPITYRAGIQYLDQKKTTAVELSGSLAATSVMISLLHDDWGTPVADQLAELSKDFLVVIAALTAEKYLLTILAALAFGVLIPFGGLLIFLSGWQLNPSLFRRGFKCIVFGLLLFIVIPLGIFLSQNIEKTYKVSVSAVSELETELNQVLEDAVPEETEAAAAENDEEKDKDKGIIGSVGEFISGVGEGAAELGGSIAEGAGNLVGTIGETVKSIPDLPAKASEALNRAMEAFAVMIVTTCVIPLVVIMALVWVLNTLLGTQFRLNPFGNMEKRHRRAWERHHREEADADYREDEWVDDREAGRE